MLKLLYKPTNNVFTLPDAEALRIKNEDRAGDYVILEAGLQEEKTEVVTAEEAVKLEEEVIEKQEEEKAKEEAKQAKKAAKEKKKEK